jgi:RNA-directed DNA polymerase
MARASDLDNISTKLHRIAHLAQESPERVLTSLAYVIDVDFLREAYRRTRKDGAVGVDGQTAAAMQRTWRKTSGPSWSASVRAVIRHRPCGVTTFPKAMGRSPVRLGFPPLRIRSSRERCRWC